MPNRRSRPSLLRPLVHAFCWCLLAAGCGRETGHAHPPAPVLTPQKVVDSTTFLRSREIGTNSERPPWIGHVNAVDLDHDGLLDVIACDSLENRVVWVRQKARGVFEERIIAENTTAPVHAEAGDVDGDGDLDVIVSCMGVVFPNNDHIGSLVILENLGTGGFKPHTILENAIRVNDARPCDLNGDGHIDLALAQFGYDQGQVQWLEQTGPWQFQPHPLFDLSGAINLCVGDFAGDAAPDLAVQFSQQWEEIHVFENLGQGTFRRKRIWGSTNEDYGSSGMTAADLDGDNRLDLVFTNGDGFGPAVVPGPRPYHGVQWLQNRGGGQFDYHRIGDASGAYSPVVTDLDGDGRKDVALVAAFIDKDGQGNPIPSLVWFRNAAPDTWEKHVLAYEPQHQVTLTAGDFSGDGRPALVSGGFYVFSTPPKLGRITLWQQPTR